MMMKDYATSMKKHFRKISDKLHHSSNATHPEPVKTRPAKIYCGVESDDSLSTATTETLNIWDAEFWQPDLTRRQSVVSQQPITIRKGRFHVTWYDPQSSIATIPNTKKPIHVRFAV